MNNRFSIIYDDRIVVPWEIDEIIGSNKFSNIRRKRTSLGKEIVDELKKVRNIDFYHILDDFDSATLKNRIKNSDTRQLFLRIPSCMVFNNKNKISLFASQIKFSNENAFVGKPSHGEAILLLQNDQVHGFLDPYNADLISDHINYLIDKFPVVTGVDDIIDLRLLKNFLLFMSGATETRSFNSLDLNNWTIKKSSRNKEKMHAEYSYFHVSPEVIKPYLVPTFGYEESQSSASYQMERIAVPDAAIQYVHHSFDEKNFSLLLERFFDFINARPKKECTIEYVKNQAYIDIIQKLLDRKIEILSNDLGNKLDQVITATTRYKNINDLIRYSINIVQNIINSDDINYLAFSHGDPCFSNILFDRRTGLFRLIDPRGASSTVSAWMHPYYDLAKFSHSVMGSYDFINNDLFDCVINDELELNILFQDGGSPDWCKEMWVRKLESHGFKNKNIRALEMTLFLSMLPFHLDFPKKIIGFLLNSINILKELESEDDKA